MCILIPAKNEALTLAGTIENLHRNLGGRVDYYILVVNDHSDDETLDLLAALVRQYESLDYVSNKWKGGVGNAIRYGLSIWEGDVAALCMADGSDSPEDILAAYWKIAKEGYDCTFGSRFVKGGGVYNYPFVKLLLNRAFNTMVRLLTRHPYNDFTNIFKVYHRRSLESISPLEAEGFSIGLEMSLKAYRSGLQIAVIPISWTQRKAGVSKLKVSKYFREYMSTLLQFR